MNTEIPSAAGNVIEQGLEEIRPTSAKISDLIKNYEMISVKNSKENDITDDVSIRSGLSGLSARSTQSFKSVPIRRSSPIAKNSPSPSSMLPKSVISHSRTIDSAISNDSWRSDVETQRSRSNSKDIVIPKAFRAISDRSTKDDIAGTASPENEVHSQESSKGKKESQVQKSLTSRVTPKVYDAQQSNIESQELEHRNPEKEVHSEKVIEQEESSQVQTPLRPKVHKLRKSTVTSPESEYISKQTDKKAQSHKEDTAQEGKTVLRNVQRALSLHENKPVVSADSRSNNKESRESSTEQATREVISKRDGETISVPEVEQKEHFGNMFFDNLQKSLSNSLTCGIDQSFLKTYEDHGPNAEIILVDKEGKSPDDTVAAETMCESSGFRTTNPLCGSKNLLSTELISDEKESRECPSKECTCEMKSHRGEGIDSVGHLNENNDINSETTNLTKPEIGSGKMVMEWFQSKHKQNQDKDINRRSANLTNAEIISGKRVMEWFQSDHKQEEDKGINNEAAKLTNAEISSGKTMMEWFQSKQQEEWNLLSWKSLIDTKEKNQEQKPQNLEEKLPSGKDRPNSDGRMTERFENKDNHDNKWHSLVDSSITSIRNSKQHQALSTKKDRIGQCHAHDRSIPREQNDEDVSGSGSTFHSNNFSTEWSQSSNHNNVVSTNEQQLLNSRRSNTQNTPSVGITECSTTREFSNQTTQWFQEFDTEGNRNPYVDSGSSKFKQQMAIQEIDKNFLNSSNTRWCQDNEYLNRKAKNDTNKTRNISQERGFIDQNRRFHRIHVRNKDTNDQGKQNNTGNGLPNSSNKSELSGLWDTSIEWFQANGNIDNDKGGGMHSSGNSFIENKDQARPEGIVASEDDDSNNSSNEHDLLGIIPEILADSMILCYTKEECETQKRSEEEEDAYGNGTENQILTTTTNPTMPENTLTKYKAAEHTCAWMYYY